MTPLTTLYNLTLLPTSKLTGIPTMNLSRLSLATTAAGFLGFGIACLVRPKTMLKKVDIDATSNTGTTELRAMYGGFEIGLGAWYAYCAAKQQYVKPALIAEVAGLGGLVATRFASILAKRPRPIMYPILAFEAATLTTGAIALKRELARNRLESIPG